MSVIREERNGPLPTLPGKAPGVIWHDPAAHRVTVQCAVCYATFTGPTSIADMGCKFSPDDDGQPPTKYRRCTDCRNARLHPEPTLFEVTP